MTEIDHDLLVAKGTIEAILTLTFEEDTATAATMSEHMDVATGTARERLKQLQEAGLVSEDAELRNSGPVRVFEATETGAELGGLLDDIIADDSDGVTDAAA